VRSAAAFLLCVSCIGDSSSAGLDKHLECGHCKDVHLGDGGGGADAPRGTDGWAHAEGGSDRRVGKLDEVADDDAEALDVRAAITDRTKEGYDEHGKCGRSTSDLGTNVVKESALMCGDRRRVSHAAHARGKMCSIGYGLATMPQSKVAHSLAAADTLLRVVYGVLSGLKQREKFRVCLNVRVADAWGVSSAPVLHLRRARCWMLAVAGQVCSTCMV
jgi:hypothetical protein